jgi:hypothetical protein
VGSDSPFSCSTPGDVPGVVRLVLVRRAQSGEAVSGRPGRFLLSAAATLRNRRWSKPPTPGARRPLLILGLDCGGMEWKTADGLLFSSRCPEPVVGLPGSSSPLRPSWSVLVLLGRHVGRDNLPPSSRCHFFSLNSTLPYG